MLSFTHHLVIRKTKAPLFCSRAGFRCMGTVGVDSVPSTEKENGKYEKQTEFFPNVVNFKARRPVSGISVHGGSQYGSIVQEEGYPGLPSVAVIVAMEQETLERRKGLPGLQVTVYREEKSQGRNLRQNRNKDHGGRLLPGLRPGWCSATLHVQPRSSSLRMASPTMGWTRLH